MDCSTAGFPVHLPLLELTQTHVHWAADAIQPSHPLSSPLLLPSIFPSVRVFFNESVLHIRWPKIWSYSFSISLSNEYSGLISFRMDWVDLFEVQGTPKSYFQHHSLVRKHLSFSAQLSLWFYSNLHTWLLEKMYLWHFGSVRKVISQLLYMLSMLVMAFLPWRKHLLISWLQSTSAVILEP